MKARKNKGKIRRHVQLLKKLIKITKKMSPSTPQTLFSVGFNSHTLTQRTFLKTIHSNKAYAFLFQNLAKGTNFVFIPQLNE